MSVNGEAIAAGGARRDSRRRLLVASPEPLASAILKKASRFFRSKI